jgi:hypothetical protein
MADQRQASQRSIKGVARDGRRPHLQRTTLCRERAPTTAPIAGSVPTFWSMLVEARPPPEERRHGVGVSYIQENNDE